MSCRPVLNVSTGRPRNPKLTLKINSLRIKHKARNFASWTFSEYAFKIGRKKRKWFFDHSTTLNESVMTAWHFFIVESEFHKDCNQRHHWLCTAIGVFLKNSQNRMSCNTGRELNKDLLNTSELWECESRRTTQVGYNPKDSTWICLKYW